MLDIGCGPADIFAHMPEVDYVGLDMSAKYIADAQNRYGDTGTFIQQEIKAGEELAFAQSLKPFDVALALGVLHHLDDAQALILLKTAKAALKKGGRLVTFDGAFVPEQSSAAKWLLRKDRGNYVRTPKAYVALARQVFPRVSFSVHHDLILLPYTHCIMQCADGADGAEPPLDLKPHGA